MATKTERFTENGKPHATLVERDDGTFIWRTWTYEADARPFAGAQQGCTDFSVQLVDPNGDIEALLDAHEELCSRPGVRNSGKGGRAAASAFLIQTKGHGVLHATTRK